MAPWRWCTADDGCRVHGEILLWVLERVVGRGVLDREGVCANHALKVVFLGTLTTARVAPRTRWRVESRGVDLD